MNSRACAHWNPITKVSCDQPARFEVNTDYTCDIPHCPDHCKWCCAEHYDAFVALMQYIKATMPRLKLT